MKVLVSKPMYLFFIFFFGCLFLILLNFVSAKSNFFVDPDYQNHVYYRAHSVITDLTTLPYSRFLNARGYIPNNYDRDSLINKIKHVFMISSMNRTEITFSSQLKELWLNLSRLSKTSPMTQWIQANFDRFVIASAFELLDREITRDFTRMFLASLKNDNRIPVIKFWQKLDHDLLVYLEFKELGAFHQWRQQQPLRLPTSASASHRHCSILAHRGGVFQHPENSMAALHDGISMGADGFEVDLRASKDGVPFVLHDHELERLTGIKADLRELSGAQVMTLPLRDPLHPDASSGEYPLHLEQLLTAFGHRTLIWLELKPDESYELVQRVGDLLQEYRLEDKVIVSSLSAQMLQPLRTRFTNLTLAYEFSTLDDVDLTPFLTAPDRHRLIISADHLESFYPDTLNTIQQAGIRTSSYTLNRFSAIQNALERGITYIQTDRPDRAYFLRQRLGCQFGR